jgi:hypothetical protein
MGHDRHPAPDMGDNEIHILIPLAHLFGIAYGDLLLVKCVAPALS